MCCRRTDPAVTVGQRDEALSKIKRQLGVGSSNAKEDPSLPKIQACGRSKIQGPRSREDPRSKIRRLGAEQLISGCRKAQPLSSPLSSPSIFRQRFRRRSLLWAVLKQALAKGCCKSIGARTLLSAKARVTQEQRRNHRIFVFTTPLRTGMSALRLPLLHQPLASLPAIRSPLLGFWCLELLWILDLGSWIFSPPVTLSLLSRPNPV